MNWQTIDLDEKRLLRGCLEDVLLCRHLQELQVKSSPSGRGYHITITCSSPPCDWCRMRWDDPIRYQADLSRPIHAANVLFDKKIKGGCRESRTTA